MTRHSQPFAPQADRLVLSVAAALAALCAVPGALAAAAGESVWLTPVVTAPTGARSPLRIYIAPAEQQCRAAYGDEWRSRCSVPLGRPGAPADGVILGGAPAGKWRWDSAQSLVFEPKDAWPAARRMRLSLVGLPLPLRASLSETTMTVETPPLAALSAHTAVWIDPRDPADRALSFEFAFTTALADDARARLENRFGLEFDKASKLRLGKPVFVWREDRTGVWVKVPVEALDDRPVSVAARLPDVAARIVQRNGAFTVPKGFESTRATVTAPGLETLFRITEASAEPVRDAGLNAEYEVTIASSLALDPRVLAEKLRVVALPARLDPEAASDTVWTEAPVIDEEALSRARPVEVRPDLEASTGTRVKLRLRAEPGDYLHLSLPEGFGPANMPGLDEGWRTVLPLPSPSAEIRFMQPGSLLTLAGSWELSLFASGCDALDWRIARVRDEFLALAADGWNVMEKTAPDAWTSAVTGTIELGAVDPKAPGTARFATLDLAEAVMKAGPGLFQIELAGRRMKDGKPEVVARTAKRILITNIAMIAKTSADGALDLFAANFADGKPAGGLKAVLLAENGTVLETAETDGDGRAHVATTRGWERERRPVAAAMRSKGTDLAWISLRDASNVTDPYRWDVGGRRTGGSGLAAFTFADRGIYRAGETVHFGLGVRKTDFERLPEGAPVDYKLTDDAGRTLASGALRLSAEGLAALDWTIPEDRPAGRLKFDLFAGDGGERREALSTTAVYVGDFAPETLTLSAALPRTEAGMGWIRPDDLKIPVALTSLFGAGAEGRRVEGEASVTPLTQTELPGWEGWTFPSPAAMPGRVLADGRTIPVAAATPGSGEAELSLPLSRVPLAGFAHVSLSLTGMEAEGSAAVGRTLEFLASPADLAVGWRLEGTPQPARFLLTGEAAEMAFVAVGRDLRAAPGTRLKVTIEKTRHVTELTEDGSGRLTYAETPVTEVRKLFDLETDASGLARVPLLTGEPGEWTVRVATAQGAPLMAAAYATAGGTLADFASGELPAAELRAKLEKTDLAPGERTKLSVLAPMEGFALATFESAGVLSSTWLKVRAGENLLEIDAPENFSGRAWLRLSLVRGQDDARRFLRGYAETAVPVTVGTAGKTLDIKVETPETVRSGVSVPVTVSAPERARVFLFAADDGILSLTGWKRPDPIGALLLDRALEVDTRETLSLLMPDAGAIRRLLRSVPGGDFVESAKAAAGFGNPFRRSFGPSAVWWGGLVEIGPEPKTIEMTVPEGFAGRLRVIAVGAAEALAGSAERAAAVAPELVVDPALPAAVSPGDRFRAGAVVTPNEPAARGRLEIRAPEGFAEGPAALEIEFPETGGRSASAEFRVPDSETALGARRFAFAAEANASADGRRLTADRAAEISVRPASLWDERVYVGRLKGDAKALTAQIPTETYPQNARTRFVASVTPAALVRELGRPFAESENDFGDVAVRIAASLPDVLLALEPEVAATLPHSVLTTEPEAAKAAAADEALRRSRVYEAVRERTGWRGLSPVAGAPADPFLGALALDYLADAARIDPLALEPLQRLRERLLDTLDLDPSTIDEARTSAYLLWALTREGTMTASRLESLRSSMASRFEGWERDAAAVFLAASYERLRMREEARSLLGGTISTARAAGAWTPATATALAAAALGETGLADTPAGRFLSSMAAEDFARTFDSGIVSPVYAAAASRAAMSASAEAAKIPAGSPDLVCTKRTPGFPTDADRLVTSGLGAMLDAPGCTAVEISGMPRAKNVWWQAEQAGWERPKKDAPAAARDRSGLEVEREYLGADGKPKTAFTPGERVTVRVTVRSYAAGEIRDAVLTDLLPGGFVWAMPAGECPDGALRCRRDEDRVQWLAPELTSWGPQTFTYTVRAAYPGEYAAAPLAAESLSNPVLRGRTAAARVLVAAPDAGKPQ